MSDTLVIPLRQPRSKGAHRKPLPVAMFVIYSGFTLAGAAIITVGVLALLAPPRACHAVPMHLGWPNSRCRLSWAKWRQP